MLTALYALVHSALWMSVCTASGYAAVYLQALDYTNTQLGIIMACGSLGGAVLGLVLSSVIDANARLSASRFVAPMLVLQAAALCALLLFRVKGAGTTAAYILSSAFCLSMTFLVSKLYVDYTHEGRRINFGIARGIGSLAFVLSSALLGRLVEWGGVRVLPTTGLLLCGFQFLFCFWFCRGMKAATYGGESQRERGNSMGVFLRLHPRFCVMLAGMIFLFFAHNTVGLFMINIVRNVGGGTSTMGYLTAFMAAVEIPVMLLFSRIRGKRSGAAILRFSFVFFTLKVAAVTAAPSVPALFAAVMLQAPSYALQAVVIVDYVNEVIPFSDSAKAQSLAGSMGTFGSVLASIVSGRLFDTVTVTQALLVATAVCAVGTVIGLLGLENRRSTALKHKK